MMKGLTVCFAIFVIAGACYVGAYVYFRETKAVQLRGFVAYTSDDTYFGETDKQLTAVFTPLIWLDKKVTGTKVTFVKPYTSIYF